jgi:glucose/mannose-6-phosphate isomerase
LLGEKKYDIITVTMFLALKRSPISKPLLESLQKLPEQINSVIRDEKNISLHFPADTLETIVINGMGGSNLGGYLIQSIFRDRLKIPLLIEPGYEIPAYVNKKTLYIVSSYSGSTEEPIAAYKIAKRRGAKIIIMCSDSNNPLRKLAKRDNVPHYFFTTTANPSNQPRLGLGYGVSGLLILFKKLSLLSIKDKDLKEIITQLKRKNSVLSKKGSEAQLLAKKLAGHETILIGGQIFEGNLRIMRNQWCETGKNFASYLVVPDMNHYALEGLSKPVSNKKHLSALVIESSLYDAKIRKRLELTKEIIHRQGIKIVTYSPSGKTSLSQSFDLLQFGSWLTYYLSIQNRVDPLPVPWVDWFKKQLLTK